ncbi:2OG-Fe(II) oxygenase [Pseudoneobacillus sp. C159]
MMTQQISKELQDWLLATLKSGVSPVVLANSLVNKGFEARYAYETLFKIVGNESIKTTEFEQDTYDTYIPAIGHKGNILYTNDREIKVLSRMERPFVIHLDNVLSHEECDELIELSRNRLEPSRIIDPVTGEKRQARGRTSKGMYYRIRENQLVEKIENRIVELTSFPIENGEGLQVLNYGNGEEYKLHFDFFSNNMVNPSHGGQRIATFLIYLNEVVDGGETVFPKIGLSVVPKKGSAVYFHYGNENGQLDRLSMHSSVPVRQGEKWVATKWIRQSKIY